MSAFDFSPLVTYAAQNNIALDAKALERLGIYGPLLLEWNEKINLTAITAPEEIITKHFIDSLSLLKHLPTLSGAVLDVGSGAGFPGMVLKIARPDLAVSLLDGHAKRFLFLEALEKEIGLETQKLHIRAELAGKNPLYRERFDLVTARAVSALPALCEYCLPLVKPGGLFAAMKGPQPQDELQACKKAVSVLGGAPCEVALETLPNGSQRSLVFIKKISQTPTKYPRASAKITKQPL